MNRRSLLKAITALFAAPVVVKAADQWPADVLQKFARSPVKPTEFNKIELSVTVDEFADRLVKPTIKWAANYDIGYDAWDVSGQFRHGNRVERLAIQIPCTINCNHEHEAIAAGKRMIEPELLRQWRRGLCS